jgi:hypothetical protein
MKFAEKRFLFQLISPLTVEVALSFLSKLKISNPFKPKISVNKEARRGTVWLLCLSTFIRFERLNLLARLSNPRGQVSNTKTKARTDNGSSFFLRLAHTWLWL